MIKTLRITSIVAAVFAAGFVVFSVIFGIRRDEQAEKFIHTPGVIEKFNKAKDQKSAESEGQTSPLVKQAQAFTLYLNPPTPQLPEDADSSRQALSPRPAVVAPKFTLIGTSYYALHPEQSLALIDEPGKGLRWVRQSSEVGRLVIEQVKDGAVLVRDDKRTFELVAEKPEKKSLLKGASPLAAIAEAKPEDSTIVAAGDIELAISLEGEEFDKITKQLEAVEADVGAGRIDAEEGSRRSEALMEEFASKIEAMRVSAAEARKLDRLGQQLKSDQTSRISAEPNRPQNVSPSKSQAPSPREGRTKVLRRRGKVPAVQSDPNRGEPNGPAEP